MVVVPVVLVMCMVRVVPGVALASSLVLVEAELAEPYPRDEDDDAATLLSLLVLEEDVTSVDESEVDDVSADVDEELRRLVGMGRRVLRVVVSVKDELSLEDPMELLAVDTDVESVPEVFTDEVDAPAYVVELPNNGEPVWVVDSPGGNAVPLLDGLKDEDEERGRSVEVYAVDVELDVASELGWLVLAVVDGPVDVLLP